MLADKIEITKQDKEIYDREGYWISPKLFDDESIERLRRAHDRIWACDFDGEGHQDVVIPQDASKIRKVNNAWWINDEIYKAVTNPLIGKIAAELMETEEVRLWADQVICKPGTGDNETNSGNVGWHQDYGYWQCTSTTNMVTVWIALQDTDLTNGGMMTICGSHKWGLIPDSDTFYEQDMEKLKMKYASLGYTWKEEPCILKAGQASFHHSLTFHGSLSNKTNTPRLSVVSHLMPKGTSYRPGIQFHSNVRYLGPRPYANQLFANEYFPIVYSSAAGKGI